MSRPVVGVVWNPYAETFCSDLPAVAAENVTLVVALPAATDARATVQHQRITRVGNAAQRVGVPTSSTVSISLQFADGTAKEMTLDNRTVYDLSAANGRLAVKKTAGGVVVSAEDAGGVGEAILVVRFTHTSVNVTIGFTVTAATGISLRTAPFPTFPGSAQRVPPSILRAVAGTTPTTYQQLALLADLEMTDGVSAVAIQDRVKVTFLAFTVPDNKKSTTVSIGGTDGNVLTASSPSVVNVQALFYNTFTTGMLCFGIDASHPQYYIVILMRCYTAGAKR